MLNQWCHPLSNSTQSQCRFFFKRLMGSVCWPLVYNFSPLFLVILTCSFVFLEVASDFGLMVI